MAMFWRYGPATKYHTRAVKHARAAQLAMEYELESTRKPGCGGMMLVLTPPVRPMYLRQHARCAAVSGQRAQGQRAARGTHVLLA